MTPRALTLLGGLGLVVAGCKSNGGLVVVSLDASFPLDAVAYVHTVAAVGERSMAYDFGRNGAPFSIPPAKTFAFDVSSVSNGTFTVEAEARDGSDVVLAAGSGSVTLAAGGRRDLVITLGDPLGDGGAPDFTGCVPTVTCESLGVLCGTPSDGCGGTLDCSPCQLDAVYQPFGIAGSNITLEGKFNASATVNFPGGVTAAATVLGPNRATVTVPTSATSGSITVTSGEMTTPPIAFRRPSFTVGLPLGFSPQFEQAEYARQTPTLSPGRTGNSAVLAGGWLYVLGGFSAGALDRVERALVNADGTIGAFLPTTTLKTASNDHASVVLGNWVYVIGGSNGSALARVERAPLGANGVLGAFADAGVALTVARSGATATIVGGYVYVIGGSNGGGALASVERAAIRGDGTLGPFSDAGVALRTARSLHSATVSADFLYVVGGSPANGSYSDRVERAPIAPDGALGAFVDGPSVHLATARSGQQMQVLGGSVYVFGGSNGTTLTSVESAAIGGDGSFGAFATVAGVSSGARSEFASVVVGNYLYEIGGNAGGAIDRAPINSSSAISSFTLSPVKLAAAGTGPGVVVGNYFYIIAGSRSQHAPIRPDGTLGDFTADSAVTASGLLAVLGNYVYALNATQPQRAAINDDGTLAPFANVAVTGKTTVTGYSLIVSGATLYSISGGTSSTDPVNTVEAATVAANGSLAFSTSGIPAVNFGHMRGSAVLLGGNIFSFAGYRAGDGYIDNAERGALNASAAVTAWANTGNRYGDFDTQTAVVGTELLIVAGAYNANAVQQCPVTDTGLAFTQLPSLGKSDRRFPGALVTNSYLYLTGGYNNAATSAYDSIEQAALK